MYPFSNVTQGVRDPATLHPEHALITCIDQHVLRDHLPGTSRPKENMLQGCLHRSTDFFKDVQPHLEIKTAAAARVETDLLEVCLIPLVIKAPDEGTADHPRIHVVVTDSYIGLPGLSGIQPFWIRYTEDGRYDLQATLLNALGFYIHDRFGDAILTTTWMQTSSACLFESFERVMICLVLHYRAKSSFPQQVVLNNAEAALLTTEEITTLAKEKDLDINPLLQNYCDHPGLLAITPHIDTPKTP